MGSSTTYGQRIHAIQGRGTLALQRGPHRERPELCLHEQGGPPVPPECQHQRNARVVLGVTSGFTPCTLLLFKDGYRLTAFITNNDDNDSELAYANAVQVQVPPITRDITVTAQGVKKQGQGKVALEKVPARCSPSRLQVRHEAGGWVGVQQVVKVMVSINSGERQR